MAAYNHLQLQFWQIQLPLLASGGTTCLWCRHTSRQTSIYQFLSVYNYSLKEDQYLCNSVSSYWIIKKSQMSLGRDEH